MFSRDFKFIDFGIQKLHGIIFEIGKTSFQTMHTSSIKTLLIIFDSSISTFVHLSFIFQTLIFEDDFNS